MKNLKQAIPLLILFVVQLAISVKIFFTFIQLSSYVNEKVFSVHQQLFAMVSVIIIIFISVIFLFMILRKTVNNEKNINKPELNKAKDSEKVSRRKRNLEEQKRLSEIEKKRNRTINSIMNGLKPSMELDEFSEKLLSNLAKQFDLVQGIVFVRNTNGLFSKVGSYAFFSEDEVPDFEEGVGIAGQVAANKELINITNLPDRYMTVLSGLGNSAPKNLIIFPVIYNDISIGVIEVATFKKIEKFGEQVLKIVSRKLGEQLSEIVKTKIEKKTE